MKKHYDHEYIAALVDQCRDGGNSDAFAELYGLTYNHVYNYACHYLNDPYAAQDALQETYIQVLKNINQLQVSTLFIAWLNQICFHVCYRMKTQHSGDAIGNGEELLDSIIASDLTILPEHQVVKEDIYQSLRKAMERLPDLWYQVVVLRFYNDMKIEEIAAALEISRSSVKRYLQAAKETMKAYLTDSWAEGCDLSEID